MAERSILQVLPIWTLSGGLHRYWKRFTGRDGLVIGIDTFGHSAPWEVIAENLGFTAPKIAEKLKEWLA